MYTKHVQENSNTVLFLSTFIWPTHILERMHHIWKQKLHKMKTEMAGTIGDHDIETYKVARIHRSQQ